jgi:hypothetical protein
MQRMTSWLLPGLLAGLLTGLPALAPAAMIGVSAPSEPSLLGTAITFQIFGSDFADGTDGGDLSVSWTPNFQYMAISIFDPPWEVQAYDDSTAALGYLDFVDVFSFTGTPGVGGVDFGIAALTLMAIGEGPGDVFLSPSLVGWSLGGESLSEVAFGHASITVAPAVVPVPAPATWLLLASAVGPLLIFTRRARGQQPTR